MSGKPKKEECISFHTLAFTLGCWDKQVVPTSIKVKHHIDNQFSLDMGVDTSHMRI
jgi:hypothetical protein